MYVTTTTHISVFVDTVLYNNDQLVRLAEILATMLNCSNFVLMFVYRSLMVDTFSDLYKMQYTN